MRGKVRTNRFPCSNRGITPAYAGKSGVGAVVLCGTGDHPRLCGEKFSDVKNQIVILGSPPPMRGKAHCLRAGRLEHRITPAYAGKRIAHNLGVSYSTDHPRLCGEKGGFAFVLYPSKGSPPPMRGKVNPDEAHRNMERITPAYAGKSNPTHSGN